PKQPLHGEIELTFQGADVVRLVRVWRGMREVESVLAVREAGCLKRISDTVYMSGRGGGRLTMARVDERSEVDSDGQEEPEMLDAASLSAVFQNENRQHQSSKKKRRSQ